MSGPVPVVDDVTLDQLYHDPYPTYQRLRKETPIAWISAAGINLVTRFDDIMTIERDEETFPAFDPRSLQIKAMGHTLMRKDGDAHKRERNVLEPSFRPGTVKNHWTQVFERIARELIDEMAPRGKADIFTDFAAPMASRALMEVIGLTNVAWEDMLLWSQSLISATGNYGNDPEIWAINEKAAREMDAAIDARIPELKANPDPSAISSMINAENPLSIEQVRANVKVVIGGGLNEPRDSICTSVYGLASNPDQLAAVLENGGLWKDVFEETVRWVAPIGMYPRRVAKRVELGGVTLEPDMPLGLCVASACHDEAYFENGGKFDVLRPRKSHLAFGAGGHFCLGTWTARKMVGEIAVPMIFQQLKNLRLDPNKPPRMGGWVFRGPLSVPVVWDV